MFTLEAGNPGELTAPAGVFIVRKNETPGEVASLAKKREKYLKLYPHIADNTDSSEPYPQKKDFYDMPKGPVSLKKEINLEKILMVNEPGELTVRIIYDNTVDFYLDSGRRVKVDSWCDRAISNPVTITIK